MALELCNGSLEDLTHSLVHGLDRKTIYYRTIKAVLELHNHNWIHRGLTSAIGYSSIILRLELLYTTDIAEDNILYIRNNNDISIRLSDFEFALELDESRKHVSKNDRGKMYVSPKSDDPMRC